MTDIKIYQGNQIGGCITVITTDKGKIVIDFGESLPGAKIVENIEFDWEKEKVDAVFFTHYHGDHIGRFMEIPDDVKLYMGKVTWNVLKNINTARKKWDVVNHLNNRPNIQFIRPTEVVEVADMSITPYSVDHSAFDAYMFLVETPDKNILHTGDYRDHGHRGHKKSKDGRDVNVMLEVIRKYVRDFGRRKIDILITEGTMLGARKDDRRYSEKKMLEDAIELFKNNKYIFLKISSTNVDSLATFYHAAEKNGMGFYCNNYVLEQLKMFSEEGKKYTDFYDFKEVWPILFTNESENVSDKYKRGYEGQRKHMREEGFVILVSEYDCYDALINEFKDLPTIFLYSLWAGYIDKDKGRNAYNPELAAFCEKHYAVPMHTSGHAYPEFIKQVIDTVEPEQVITIHTETELN